MLLRASPTYASRRPSSVPKRSLIVSRSASAWQGCAACESPLIDRHRGGGGEALERLVRVRADDDRVDEAGELARDVLGRLALADHELAAGGEERVAAELGHRDLEGHARAQAGLLEEHRQALPLEQAMLVPRRPGS